MEDGQRKNHSDGDEQREDEDEENLQDIVNPEIIELIKERG